MKDYSRRHLKPWQHSEHLHPSTYLLWPSSSKTKYSFSGCFSAKISCRWSPCSLSISTSSDSDECLVRRLDIIFIRWFRFVDFFSWLESLTSVSYSVSLPAFLISLSSFLSLVKWQLLHFLVLDRISPSVSLYQVVWLGRL